MTNAKRIYLSPPWIGAEERRAMKAAFDSGYVAPCGPQVDAFEVALAKYAHRKYAVAVSSGTAALDLLMAHLGVDSNWTIIAPTLTFIATVGPAWHRGAKLVFVDSDETGSIDCELLSQALKDIKDPVHTLVIGVDLYGICCNYDKISQLCRRAHVKLIIDSAEAVGATYKKRPAGSAAFAAIYSFNGNKIITTSGGGAILTDSKVLAEHVRKLAQQSREPAPWYEHREVGYNYRMSNLLAALGLAQLAKLPRILEKRAQTAAFYERLLPKRILSGGNHWLSVAIFDTPREAQKLGALFKSANIEARPVWKPLHLQPVFAGVKVYGGEVAEALYQRGICLPSGTGLTKMDYKRIESVIKEVIQ